MAWNVPSSASVGQVLTNTVVNDILGDLTVLQLAVGLYGYAGDYGGSPPPVGTPSFLMVPMTAVGSTDSSGNLPISFPIAFPNGILTILVCPGDNVASLSQVQVEESTVTTSGFTAGCLTNTGAIINTELVRVNVLAFGW